MSDAATEHTEDRDVLAELAAERAERVRLQRERRARERAELAAARQHGLRARLRARIRHLGRGK
jgi:hypothetical protein